MACYLYAFADGKACFSLNDEGDYGYTLDVCVCDGRPLCAARSGLVTLRAYAASRIGAVAMRTMTLAAALVLLTSPGATLRLRCR